ncbi:MAG: hypothetical protein KGL39_09515 [Patescibacteria group bacterium]|nr:hypothetical protein [Patescibacteria group bacterium]
MARVRGGQEAKGEVLRMKHFRPGLPPVFTGPDALPAAAPVAKPPSAPTRPRGNLTASLSPLVNADGLRTDGPTLAEYVAAGYKAESYPPQGYAPKLEPPQGVNTGAQAEAQALADKMLAEAKALEAAAEDLTR